MKMLKKDKKEADRELLWQYLLVFTTTQSPSCLFAQPML